MRILLTGFNARSTGSKLLRMTYVSTSGALLRGLSDLGHEVDMRPPVFGEDLSAYDLALIALALLGARGTYHHEKCAWVLKAMADRCVLYFDDWSTYLLAYDMDYRLNVIRDKYLRWRGWENLPRNVRTTLVEEMNRIISPSCPWPLLLPTFAWGDHSLITTARPGFALHPSRVYTLDPTYLAELPPVPVPAPAARREHAWVHATLQDNDRWLERQQCGWPVKRFGNVRLGDPCVDEEMVVNEYARAWGITCPEYKISGSGWWRMRYHYAAALGCVMLTTGADARALGEAFQFTARDYEAMALKRLREVAQAQGDRVRETMDTRRQALAKLARMVDDNARKRRSR